MGMKLPFSNSKGYDSPSASPRGHSPVSSLVSMPYKELKSHPNQEKDLSIKTAIKDRSRKKKWSSKLPIEIPMIWMRFGRILGMEGFRKAMMNGNWICINLHLCPQGVSAGDECVDVDKSSTTITTWMT